MNDVPFHSEFQIFIHLMYLEKENIPMDMLFKGRFDDQYTFNSSLWK